MSAKWTEGPLQYRKSGADDFTIYNDMGADLALVLGWPTEADETDPEAEANAKLYAAAPDLAEALTELLAWAQDFGESGDGGFFDFSEGELGKKCRAALAKAGAT